MSWSVAASGQVEEVRKEVVRQASPECASPCLEPEETVRQAALKVIDTALEAQDPAMVVKVAANGSMGYKDWQAKTGCNNSLSITIAPQG